MLNLFQKRFGFTLAEVLITLGVIGIVAAMTIPTLINNYQKSQYVTQLKKGYVTFQAGLKGYMASQGVSNLGDTDLFSAEDEYDEEGDFENASRQSLIDGAIRKAFPSVIKTCKYGDNSCLISGYTYLGSPGAYSMFGPTNYNFCLADGMCFSLYLEFFCSYDPATPGPMKGACGEVVIDVNGAKKPNKRGRDVFNFMLGPTGDIFPYRSVAWAISSMGANYQGTGEYWQEDTSACGSINSANVSGVDGNGCAARIMDESWQMNY